MGSDCCWHLLQLVCERAESHMTTCAAAHDAVRVDLCCYRLAAHCTPHSDSCMGIVPLRSSRQGAQSKRCVAITFACCPYTGLGVMRTCLLLRGCMMCSAGERCKAPLCRWPPTAPCPVHHPTAHAPLRSMRHACMAASALLADVQQCRPPCHAMSGAGVCRGCSLHSIFDMPVAPALLMLRAAQVCTGCLALTSPGGQRHYQEPCRPRL